jgi:hypothetical protein
VACAGVLVRQYIDNVDAITITAIIAAVNAIFLFLFIIFPFNSDFCDFC